MNRTRMTLLVAVLLCLSPSVVWANGWGAVEVCFEVSFLGAIVGCIVGLVVALCKRATRGAMYGWTIGGGLAIGVGGMLIHVLVAGPNNPDFPIFALMGAAGAALIAGVGGAVLAAIVGTIRSNIRPNDENDKPPTHA